MRRTCKMEAISVSADDSGLILIEQESGYGDDAKDNQIKIHPEQLPLLISWLRRARNDAKPDTAGGD